MGVGACIGNNGMDNGRQAVPDVGRFVHRCREHVRWGDMDAFGHVNNVQFFRYLEGARIAYARAIIEGPIGATGENVILADQRCSFLQQLTWPGELEVLTRTSRMGRSSFHLEQVIRRSDSGDVAAVGQGVMVWFDFDAQRAAPIPDALRQRVIAYERVRPQGM